jgi:hypothetical protein
MRKILALLMVLPCAAAAEFGKVDVEFDNEKPWAETQAQLPPPPREENLLPFFVSAATDNKFFIDAASISVGGDGVVRYTLVVRSSAGASNVSFEGIRCNTGERKLYAFGRSDGTWGQARNSRWERIRYEDRNRHHVVLHNDFFCPDGIIIGSPREAIDALKRGFNP